MTDYISLIISVLLAFCHVLILRKCMIILLGSWLQSIKSKLLWLGYLIFIITGNILPSVRGGILLMGNLLFLIAISVVLIDAPLRMNIFFSFIICAMWSISEVLVGTMFQLHFLEFTHSDGMLTFLSQMLMLIVVFLIGKFHNEKLITEISIKRFLTLAFIPLFSIYLVNELLKLAEAYPQYDRVATVTSGSLLLINYFIFDLYDSIKRNTQLVAENQLFAQQLEMSSRHTAEQELMYNELRTLRHDMKNHMTSLLGIIKAGDNDKAVEYIKQLSGEVDLFRHNEICRTGNVIIDSLINNKYSVALNAGIDFDADIFVPNVLPFKDEHVVIILGNLLENALEANYKITDQNKYIKMEMKYEKSMLHICIKNRCIDDKYKYNDGLVLTTKEDKANHGMGLPSVRRAVQEYNGDLMVKKVNDEFVSVAVLYAQ